MSRCDCVVRFYSKSVLLRNSWARTLQIGCACAEKDLAFIYHTIRVYQKIPETPGHTTLQLHRGLWNPWTHNTAAALVPLKPLSKLHCSCIGPLKSLSTPHCSCRFSHCLESHFPLLTLPALTHTPCAISLPRKPWLIVKITSIAPLLCFLWPSYLTRPAECSFWSFLSGIPVHNPENASNTVVLSLLPPVSSYTSKQRTPHSVIQVWK